MTKTRKTAKILSAPARGRVKTTTKTTNIANMNTKIQSDTIRRFEMNRYKFFGDAQGRIYRCENYHRFDYYVVVIGENGPERVEAFEDERSAAKFLRRARKTGEARLFERWEARWEPETLFGEIRRYDGRIAMAAMTSTEFSEWTGLPLEYIRKVA